MRSFHQLVVLALPLLGMVTCDEHASPTKQTDRNAEDVYSSPNEAFQDLLNALPEESLHAALNSLGHFRDGIFESHRHGVEAVHNKNPPLATKLIVAAVQDLQNKNKRQATNGTTTQPPPAQEPSSTPPKSPPVVIPVPVETTDAEGRTTTAETSILSEPTASVAVVTTRTNDQGSVEVATTTKPAVIASTTDAAGRATVVTSAVDFAPTSGQVLTRTNAQGSTFLTTYTPDGAKVSKVVLRTTTGEDGQPSVVTSYTFVDPAAAATTANNDEQPTAGNTARPGLQSGAAGRHVAVDAALYGGALGGALAFFV